MRTDSRLRPLLARLHRMAPDERLAIFEQLSPAERDQLERFLRPAPDPQDMLSESFAAYLTGLRDDDRSSVAPLAKKAFLGAEATASAEGVATTFNMPLERPSLVARLFSRPRQSR